MTKNFDLAEEVKEMTNQLMLIEKKLEVNMDILERLSARKQDSSVANQQDSVSNICANYKIQKEQLTNKIQSESIPAAVPKEILDKAEKVEIDMVKNQVIVTAPDEVFKDQGEEPPVGAQYPDPNASVERVSGEVVE